MTYAEELRKEVNDNPFRGKQNEILDCILQGYHRALDDVKNVIILWLEKFTLLHDEQLMSIETFADHVSQLTKKIEELR